MEKTQNSLPECTFLACTKFFNSLRVEGATQKQYMLERVAWDDKRLLAGIVSHGPDKGNKDNHIFSVQFLLSTPEFAPDIPVMLHFSGCQPITITLGEIANIAIIPSGRLLAQFQSIINDNSYTRMLDIGGRARSGVLYADQYRDKRVVVLDILPDKGVDVVCDAHQMSNVLKPASFDVVFSVSVFEHLVMPWKVAIEMNRIMRVGAVGLIVTHQTVGMHDMPWDFFRFSDSAWKGLFNKHTGFEILGTEVGDIQYIIPHTYQSRYRDVEHTGGYEYSGVLIRKVAETSLDWPLGAHDVTQDMYPE